MTPRSARRRLAAGVAAAAAAAAVLTGCGSSSSTTSAAAGAGSGSASGGSVVFTGTVTGTWKKGGDATESSCSAKEIVVHIIGPGTGDEGNLHVQPGGHILLDAEKYGDFTADKGATINGTSFTIDADLTLARGGMTHVTGTLSC